MLNEKELIRRLKSAAVPDHAIQGCSEREIIEVQEQVLSPLPESYIRFLRAIGKGAGRFMRDVEVFYPKMLGLTAKAREILNDWEGPTLPDEAFVFSMRAGEQFTFFDLASTTNDPPVYFYYEGDEAFRQIADSIWQLLERELELTEEFYRRFPNSPLLQ